MKPKSIRRVAALIFASACPSVLLAAPSAEDSFPTGGPGYALSPLIGQSPTSTGFSGAWLEAYTGAGSPNVIAGGLSYTDGSASVAASGGAIEYPLGGNGRAGRLFATGYNNASAGNVYFAFMIQPDTDGIGYRGVEFHNGSLGDGDRRIQIAIGEPGVGEFDNNFIVRLFNNNGDGFAGDLGSAGTDVNFFVGKITFSTANDGDSISLWRNPPDLSSEALSGTPSFTKSGFNLQIDRIAVARFNGADGFKADEIRLGSTWSDVTTVANTSDTDNDGLPDAYELDIINFNESDLVDGLEDVAGPNNLPATTDFDADGLSDAAEYVKTTNPTNPDTDGDGLSDGVETDTNVYVSASNTGTDPKDNDSDDDGLRDNVENDTGTFASLTQTGTDPNITDTDGDGENDGYEVVQGTDPNNNTSSTALLGNPVVDGAKDAQYGTAIAVQTIETGFGDNFSEWNAAYGSIKNGRLYLLFTGNLEANFNKLSVFIDSKSGGSNTYASSGNDGTNAMNGMIFDSSFLPDYHLVARRGSSKFDLDMAVLGGANFSSFPDVFGGSDSGSGATGTGAGNTKRVSVSYNGSNAAGIGGNTGVAADQVAAAAVTTGLEIAIDLADLGNPTGPIKVMLLQASSNHGFLSNQTLAGLPVSFGNLGDPTTTNFSSFAGDQFFTVTPSDPYNTWAAANAGGQAANLDFDGDGVPNGVEFFMGETGSSFTATPGVVGGVITWPKSDTYTGAYGVNHVVQTSGNLTSWTDILITDPNLNNGDPLQYTLPSGSGPLFVRLKVIAP